MTLRSRIFVLSSLLLGIGCFAQIKSFLSNNGKILSEEEYGKAKISSLEKVRKELGTDTELFERLEVSKESKDSIQFAYRWEFLSIENHFEMTKAQALVGKKVDWQQLHFLQSNDAISLDTNKPTLINFWFTACPPCIKEMPALNDLKEKYGDKVNFIAITFDKKDKVERFLQKHKFKFVHAIDARTFINTLEITGYPKTFILDKAQIIRHFEGALPEKDDSEFYHSQIKILESQIEKYL